MNEYCTLWLTALCLYHIYSKFSLRVKCRNEDIVMNACNWAILVTIDSHNMTKTSMGVNNMTKTSMGVNGDPKWLSYKRSLQYLHFWSAQ